MRSGDKTRQGNDPTRSSVFTSLVSDVPSVVVVPLLRGCPVTVTTAMWPGGRAPTPKRKRKRYSKESNLKSNPDLPKGSRTCTDDKFYFLRPELWSYKDNDVWHSNSSDERPNTVKHPSNFHLTQTFTLWRGSHWPLTTVLVYPSSLHPQHQR